MDVVSAAERPRIRGEGTPGSLWRRWLQGASFGLLDDALWSADTRLTVIAPHPDDEILMCGGLLHRHLMRGRECRVIGVTDGDKSHEGSPSWTGDALATARRQESLEGLQALGAAAPSEQMQVMRLGFADSGVAACESELVAWLAPLLAARDVVITTWRHDGHPDHEATGRAVASAARHTGAAVLEAPVWMWHWAEPEDSRVPWASLRRAPLSVTEVEVKAEALKAHHTQLTPRLMTGAPALEPVLGAEIVRRAEWPEEYFFRETTS